MTPVDAMFASICSGILQLVQRVVAQLRTVVIRFDSSEAAETRSSCE